jgi:hypothetical protein
MKDLPLSQVRISEWEDPDRGRELQLRRELDSLYTEAIRERKRERSKIYSKYPPKYTSKKSQAVEGAAHVAAMFGMPLTAGMGGEALFGEFGYSLMFLGFLGYVGFNKAYCHYCEQERKRRAERKPLDAEIEDLSSRRWWNKLELEQDLLRHGDY